MTPGLNTQKVGNHCVRLLGKTIFTGFCQLKVSSTIKIKIAAAKCKSSPTLFGVGGFEDFVNGLAGPGMVKMVIESIDMWETSKYKCMLTLEFW